MLRIGTGGSLQLSGETVSLQKSNRTRLGWSDDLEIVVVCSEFQTAIIGFGEAMRELRIDGSRAVTFPGGLVGEREEM